MILSKHIIMSMKSNIILGGVLLFIGFISAPYCVSASDVVINPLFLDLEVEGRDIISKDITLENKTAGKLVLYATVNEVAVDTSGEIMEFVTPVMTDRTDTVTSWIEITRGRIELEPGETKVIPLTVKIHPFAKAGNYHAFIGFVNGSKRDEAEKVALRGDADGVVLKVALGEKKDELLRITSFLVDRFIFSEAGKVIDIEIKNDGESEATPSGEIIFYNSLGEEVSSVLVATADGPIPGGQSRLLSLALPLKEQLGRYKANIVLNYGVDQQAAVFDTVQFFMIPLPLLIGILIAIVVLSLLLTYLIRRAFHDELHESDADNDLPLRVRNDRAHEEKDHDIHITKK